MPSRFDDPDHQLAIPRSLFTAEGAGLLNRRELKNWDDQCELLLDDAFVRGYGGGPIADFRDLPASSVFSRGREPSATTLTIRQTFLRDLIRHADGLREDVTRRPYWRERKVGRRDVDTQLDTGRLASAFVALVDDLDERGYLEMRFGKDCVDNPQGGQPSQMMERELDKADLWPLSPQALAADVDLFFDVVELLHDLVSRPRTRWYHSYSECGWHHDNFDVPAGRLVYRWSVNRLLARTGHGLRLAEDGEDLGRLVTVTDEARTALVHSVAAREDGEPADQVRHALALFRERGADRNQKRSAVAVLGLVLEERRNNVLADAMASKDSGALFQIANGFHIRHQDARQQRGYDEFYLDWIFWVYLASVELTNRVIDQQGQVPQG